jgi:hypothetical protein
MRGFSFIFVGKYGKALGGKTYKSGGRLSD